MNLCPMRRFQKNGMRPRRPLAHTYPLCRRSILALPRVISVRSCARYLWTGRPMGFPRQHCRDRRHLALTVLYAIAFIGIYSRPHTAVAASDWINANVEPRSSIVNGGSYWDEQIPELRDFDVWTFPAYHPDRDPHKIPDLVDRLADSDYVIFYSNRGYGSVARLPAEFPKSSVVYLLLFSGDLGYRLERAFTSYPSLAGVHLRDDPYGRAGLPPPALVSNSEDWQPDGLRLNLGYADENVVGYDHPQVMVFKNTELLDARLIHSALTPLLYPRIPRAPR